MIHDYSLVSFTPKLIEIFIHFAKPKALSRNVIRPELIIVDFKHPFYSASGTSLEVQQQAVSSIPIQYTQEEEEAVISFEE